MSKFANIINEEKVIFFDFIKMFFPKGKKEKTVFYVSLVFYFLLGLYLLFTTSVIDSKKWLVDSYWGFDSSAIFLRGYTNIPRHPLLTVFTKPLMLIGDLLVALTTYKAKGILFVLFCNTCVSLSVLYIYRYLKQIVRVKSWTIVLLIIFTVLNPTFIILSFTSDTFTFSLPFLCFILYYYSDLIVRNKEPKLVPQLCLTTLVGGITISNIVLAIIPSFFTKISIKKQVRNLMVIGGVFFILILIMDYKHGIFSNLFAGISGVSGGESVGYGYVYIVDCFFGVGLVLSKVTTLDKHLMLDITEFPNSIREIVPTIYNSAYYYISLAVIYGFIIWSVLKNIKNKHVIILVLVLVWSVLIHIVGKFGVHELYLYSGHWVYIVPLILGWGFMKVPSDKIKICNILFAIFILGITINNIYHFVELVSLAQEYYPPI